MALAVCLLFDAAGDRLVSQLWTRLEAQGVRTLLTHTHRRHRPHLSLAVARSWDLERVLDALDDLPAAEPSRVAFPGIVAFTRGRASLAGGVSADLAQRQQAVVEAVVASGADLHRNYEPGRWIPHVSLTTGGSATQLAVISNVVNDALPLTISIVSAAVIDSGTAQAWPLPRLV
jgi:hypothetical protein